MPRFSALRPDYSDLRKAVWFDSPSWFLNGARPRELLGMEPELVVKAAVDAIAFERMA